MRTTRLIAAAAVVLAIPLTGFASVAGIAEVGADIAKTGPGATLDAQFASVGRGSYRLTTLGTEASMRLDADYWMVKDDQPGMTVFADAGLPSASSRDVTFVAPSRLVVSGSTSAVSGTNGIDIDRWLDSVDAGVLVSVPSDAMVGGRRAMRFDIDLTAAYGLEAIDFLSTPGGDTVSFEPGRQYNVWWIGDSDPIAIIAGSDGGSHPFLYQAEQLLEGLAFADAR